MKPAAAERSGSDREADRRRPAELGVEPDREERDDRDRGDRDVLAAQVRGCALLHGAGDLLHPLAAGGLLQQPPGEVEPESDRDARADERERNSVVIEEIHQASVRIAPSQSERRGVLGAGDYVAQAAAGAPVQEAGSTADA